MPRQIPHLYRSHMASTTQAHEHHNYFEQRINDEIELMPDPVEFKNELERPMLFDHLDENVNLLDDFTQSSAFSARSPSPDGSPFSDTLKYVPT